MIYFSVRVKTTQFSTSKRLPVLGGQMPCETVLLLSVGLYLYIQQKRTGEFWKWVVLSWLGTWWTFGFSPHIPAAPWCFAFWSRPQIVLQGSLAGERVSILWRGEVRDSVLAGSHESGLSFQSRATVLFSKNLKSFPEFEKFSTCLC